MSESTENTSKVSIKAQSFKSVFWKFYGTMSNMLVSFIISVLLARMIMPSQFGVIAMVSVFITISETLIDSGFCDALLRKQNRTQTDCCTVFYFNVFVSAVLYLIIYAAAPYIADFYDMPQLSKVLRVLSIGILISSVTTVQGTLLKANMEFKPLAKFLVYSTMFSGVVGVVMAYYGFEVWALVTQSLMSTIISSLMIWFKSKWRPTLEFSYQSLKEFFSYGSKLLMSRIINSVYESLNTIVIGKLYKAADLAYYTRAVSLSGLAGGVPTNIIQSVSYPALCKIQDDKTRLKEAYRQILKLAAYIVFPIVLGLGGLAEPVVNVLFTSRWAFTADLIKIVVFYIMLGPITEVNLNVLLVLGRSDLFLRLQIIKKIIGVMVIVITAPIGIKAMCYGGIVNIVLCMILNSYYTKSLIGYSLLNQLRDLSHSFIMAIMVYLICLVVVHFSPNDYLSIGVGISVSVIFYIAISMILKLPEFNEILRFKSTMSATKQEA